MTACDLYKQHHWHFACQIQRDYISQEKSTTTIEGKVIEKTIPIARKDSYAKFLFYCPCGRLKVIDESSINNLTSSSIDSYQGKIQDS